VKLEFAVVGVSNGVQTSDADVEVLADEAEPGYVVKPSCEQPEIA